jgi:nitrite reductase (NO-forming)
VSRSSWHLRTGAVVIGWLAAVLVVGLAHPFVPASRWLLVHLLVLGAASNAILIWSWHFTATLLRLPDDVTRRGQVLRLVLFNAGAFAAVAGTVAGRWWMLLGGGVAVAVVAAWHAVALLRHMRRALPSRFGVTVRYYVAAGLVLPFGVGLGVMMARGGGLAGGVQSRVVVAHAVLNLLGWIGLTVVGTLVTLWPTMLRTRIADGAAQTARRALPVLLAGLSVAAGAALGGSLLLAAAGLLVYLGGMVAVAAPHVEEVRRKTPSDFATTSVLAGIAWLAGSIVALAAGVATAGDWVHAADRAGWLTAPLLAGFAAQVLLGALTYLVPVVLGGGPTAVRATTAVLNRGGPARVVIVNAGLLVCVLPVPSLVRVFTSMLVLGALATFLPLAVRAAVAARRLRNQPAAPAGPERTRVAPGALPVRRRMGLATAGLAAVVLAAAAGVAVDPAALGRPGASAAADVRPTGRTTTATVEVRGMRFVPEVLEVPAGDRLVVVLTNSGDQRHDLVLETGARTPRLAPGERAQLDAGVVGRNLDGWCSVAGHRQMGMVLQVHATGAAPAPEAHHPDGADGGPSSARDLDLAAPPGPGFAAYDPALPAAPAARTHRVTLAVEERERPVAPGVTQTLWTFGGTAPGPTLRGKVGDVFDITLVNDGTIGHSIDFHAGVLAPDRPMRTIQPGESLTYRFTATRSGIWMYHCSTMPMSLHIANGMFGAVVIDPPDLALVDREYVLVQSELYLGPQGGVADAARVRSDRPDLVVFNGYADQYDHAPLRARVGERVRIWVLAAGPNRGSAFHVVGGQFDTVYREGSYELRSGTGGSQVLGLSPAQGGFVELTFPEPGSYPFLTHAMADAERGAHGVVRVRGRG